MSRVGYMWHNPCFLFADKSRPITVCDLADDHTPEAGGSDAGRESPQPRDTALSESEAGAGTSVPASQLFATKSAGGRNPWKIAVAKRSGNRYRPPERRPGTLLHSRSAPTALNKSSPLGRGVVHRASGTQATGVGGRPEGRKNSPEVHTSGADNRTKEPGLHVCGRAPPVPQQAVIGTMTTVPAVTPQRFVEVILPGSSTNEHQLVRRSNFRGGGGNTGRKNRHATG